MVFSIYTMLNSKTTAEKSATRSAPEESTSIVSSSAISSLKFPFKLTKDQLEAVNAWVSNGYKGSIIYSTGTGKTEIAFECAKRASEAIVQPKDNNVLSNHNNNAINNSSWSQTGVSRTLFHSAWKRQWEQFLKRQFEWT